MTKHFRRRFDPATAEDAAAKVFLRLTRSIERGTTSNPEALLATLLHDVEVEEYRGQNSRPEPVGLTYELNDMLEDGFARPLWPSEAEEVFSGDFDQVIRTLDPDDRDAFILTELRGASQEEAAAVLETSQPTVSRRAESARQTLRREIVLV